MKLKEQINFIFEKYNFFPRKSLSQNFLIDPKILSRLIEEINLKGQDLVLEIGAGTGILTSELASRARKVWAVEIDEKLCEILKEELAESSNLEIICADVTKLCLEKFFPQGKKIKVVGNLPYHIASWLMLELARKYWVDHMVFTIQREVAEKITASPGSKKRGMLTVLLTYYADVEKVIDIPPQAFYPSPKIGSTVVKIRPNKKLLARNERIFMQTVRAAFASRRKTLLNALTRGLGMSRENTSRILIKAKIPENKRAEQLKLEDFIRLSNLIEEGKVASSSC